MNKVSRIARYYKHYIKHYLKQALLISLILFGALIASMLIRSYMQAKKLPPVDTQDISNTVVNNEKIEISDTIQSVKHPNFSRVFSIGTSFAEAKEDLLFTIAANGLEVSHTSYIKDMLANTAEVAGVKTPVYNKAEIVSFCKADLSHALVKANPHNIVLCPFSIAIYVLHDEPERVYLSFRKPDASEVAAGPMQELLVKIIENMVW
jgi:uncharacterized protein (DUF302 family)